MKLEEMSRINKENEEAWKRYFENLRKKMEDKFILDPIQITIDDLKDPSNP